MSNKTVIFSAPSGSGKSTIVHHILELHPEMEFSVSAASRAPRGKEQDGIDYYFITPEEFTKKIENNEFVEYEQVYKGRYYGTLKKEVQRIWNKGNVIIFDVDVQGGLNLKKYFGEKALSVFIQAPSIEVLKERLINRGTDSEADIEARISKAAEEMTYADRFDYILINDKLEKAFADIDKVVDEFLK